MVDENDNEEQLFPASKPSRSPGDIYAAELQIVENIKDVRDIVREYRAEVVVLKYLKGKKQGQNEIYVPDYQRDLIWSERNQSGS